MYEKKLLQYTKSYQPGKNYVFVLNRLTENDLGSKVFNEPEMESEILIENIENGSDLRLDEISRFLCKPKFQPVSSKVVKIKITRIEK